MVEQENQQENQQEKQQVKEKPVSNVVHYTDNAPTVVKEGEYVFDFSNIDSLLAVGAKIASSDFTPLGTPQDVVSALLAGRELGLPPMASLTNIYPINGRASLGINIIIALCYKNNTFFTVIEDFKPIYVYKDATGAIYQEEDINDKNFVIITKTTDKSTIDASKIKIIRSEMPKDYRTKVEFERYITLPNKSLKEIKITSEFTLSEATQRGYTDKDNWKKMPKTMMRTRAISAGARLIGADFLMGMGYEISEMAEGDNRTVEVDDNGNVIKVH